MSNTRKEEARRARDLHLLRDERDLALQAEGQGKAGRAVLTLSQGLAVLCILQEDPAWTVLLSLSFALSPAEWVLLLADGLLFALLCAPLGLWLNLRFPKLDAVNDAVVVKQSMAAVLATFLPMVLLIPFFLAWLFLLDTLGSPGILGLYAAVLALAASGAFALVRRQGPVLFRQLSE